MRVLSCFLASAAVSFGQLVNLSSRQFIGTGTQETTVTFTIATDSTATVLLRSVGPTLETFGLSGMISDPALELYAGSTLISSNNDWQDSQASELSTAFSTFGAFSLSGGSTDSALLISLAAGTYTARLFGAGGVTGNGLNELYIRNGSLSSLVFNSYKTGGNSGIIGFVMNGIPDSHLIRLRGSSAHDGGLADPVLAAFGSSGSVIASNDNWADDANASLITGYSNALALAPLSSTDAGIIFDGAAGAYTIHATGSATGLFQFEIHDLNGISAVPEPSTWALLAGLVGGGAVWWRRRK